MKNAIIILLCAFTLSFAQKSTIDISLYKKSKKHVVAEKTYIVGTHSFTIVNIKPSTPNGSDTACISAIMFDKRKYLMFDIDAPTGAIGLVVPPLQPVKEGLIILKASQSDAKTFLLLTNGKVVSLPGSMTLVDTVGNCIYCVWDNEKAFKLTVFNYKTMGIVIRTTDIIEPKQWFNNAMGYCFMGTDKKFYSVDFFTKSVLASEKPDGELAPLSYFVDIDKIERTKCCGLEVLKK